MPGFLTHYGHSFSLPGVPRLLVTALVARMPVGMMSLSLLMHLRELSGSFAFGGGIVGTYFVAMAASAPIRGPPRRPTRPPRDPARDGIVQPVALGLLLFAGAVASVAGGDRSTGCGRGRFYAADFRADANVMEASFRARRGSPDCICGRLCPHRDQLHRRPRSRWNGPAVRNTRACLWPYLARCRGCRSAVRPFGGAALLEILRSTKCITCSAR